MDRFRKYDYLHSVNPNSDASFFKEQCSIYTNLNMEGRM